MKIKLDENLPIRLVRILAALDHEIDTVPQEGLAGQDDAHVSGKRHKRSDAFSSRRIWTLLTCAGLRQAPITAFFLCAYGIPAAMRS